MTDILAGKPDPNDFFITVEGWDWDQRFDVSAYLNARDVWLEKLKAEWVETKRELRKLHEEYDYIDKEADELDDKLRAVKTHLTKWVSGHSDWQMGRMSQWKKELDEIVEDSEK